MLWSIMELPIIRKRYHEQKIYEQVFLPILTVLIRYSKLKETTYRWVKRFWNKKIFNTKFSLTLG